MAGPQVVFCSNNHIYDKSLNSECPYCKQNSKRSETISSEIQKSSENSAQSVGKVSKKRNRDENEDRTTHLFKKKKGLVVDDDVTSGLFGKETVPSEEDDRTVYIDRRSEKTVVPEQETIDDKNVSSENSSKEGFRVIGWLVCIKSDFDYGRSFELKEGYNSVTFDDSGRLKICYGDQPEKTADVNIFRESETGIFQIQSLGSSNVVMNTRVLSGCLNLEPYSRIELSKANVVFFPAVGACGFEWRQ